MDKNAIRSKKIGTRRLTLLDVSPNRVGGILQFIIRDDRGDGGVFESICYEENIANRVFDNMVRMVEHGKA